MSDKTQHRPSKRCLIIEIGNDWLKIAQSEPSKDGVSISGLHLEKFATLNSTLSGSISDAARRLKIAKIPVIGYLPRQLVNIRMLELPSTDRDEITDMVDLQIGKQTPYSKDEIVSGYKIIESNPEGYSKVMLVIVQRAVLRQRYQIIEEAGFDVERMSVSSEGLLSWFKQTFPSQKEGKAVAVLDVDSFYSDFMVFLNGNLVFTRSILVGAEKLLGEYERWKDKLSQEIKQSLEIYKGESHDSIPESLIIVGAGANIKELTNSLNEHLQISVEIRDPLRSVKKMPSQPSMNGLEYKAVSLTALIGTALAPECMEFNFVPDSVALKRSLVDRAKSLTKLCIMIMTALISISMYAVLHLSSAANRLQAITTKLEETSPVVTKVESMLGLIRVVKERQEPRFTALNLLLSINGSVPENIYNDSLDINIMETQVVIGGYADSTMDVRNFVSNLRNSPLFDNVREGGATVKEKTTDKYKFQIICDLEKVK